MGVSYIIQWSLLSTLCFLGHGNGDFGRGYSRNSEKTQKTPQKEIEKAEAIRKEYFNNKK